VLRTLKSMLRPSVDRLISRLDKRHDNVVPVDYGDGNLFIYADSEFERAVRTIPGAKEPDTIKWIETFIKPGETVFDVGANVGNYSLIIAHHLAQKVSVFAFEPAWFNFTQLNRNVALNGFESCVFPVCAALSSADGLNWLYYSTLEYGSSMHSLDKAVRLKNQPFTPKARQPVAAFTLDRAVDLLNAVPNHIKIDVDGIENEIVKGAATTLANTAVKSVLIELSSDDPEDKKTIDTLVESGFKIWNVHQKPRNEFVNFAAHANYIFVR
jgi:FkbM family methyltransferase